MPLVWHVNDPEEFWDAERCPAWARRHGWFYDESFVGKEQLYAEVDHVLERHPGLRVVFAHFYFLSADLPRAARFLGEHPTVNLDITPGIELLYNMSRDPGTSRQFFIRFADRILFGTDISSTDKVEKALELCNTVRRWLETDHVFREVDDYGVLKGLALPADVLEKIYRLNFERLAGSPPKPLDRVRARRECERIDRQMQAAAALDGLPKEFAARARGDGETARRAAGMLA
jgi:predicted TIM-barrel fold metal-dependent hydrolase